MSSYAVSGTGRPAQILVNGSNTRQETKASEGNSFQELQKNMELELERKRLEWEEEVRKMQNEFFGLKCPSNGTKSMGRNDNVLKEKHVRVKSADSVDGGDGVDGLDMVNNDPHRFRVTFDLRGYPHETIDVKVK